MYRQFIPVLGILVFWASLLSFAQETGSDMKPLQTGDVTIDNPLAQKLPADVILVRGAVPGSTDSATPVPEAGSISGNIYTNKYFGISYALPPGFTQKYFGPPPSDSGYYVLTQLEPRPEFEAAAAGSVLVSAQDLFFGLVPAETPLALIEFRRSKLGPDFKIERQPVEVKLGNHSFIRFDYMSPVAGLHWYTLATQVRCHAVQFQFTSRDSQLLESMVQQLAKTSLLDNVSSDGAKAPVCIKNYAAGSNLLHKVDPVFAARKFNRIPARLIIDKYGKVKHIHVLSAFPDQIKAINEALLQWEFKPYKVNGEPVEVETGIVFGEQPAEPKAQTNTARVSD